MQIFEINKKNTDVLVFSGITIISKKKALKSKKQRVVRKTTTFIENGNAETNSPYNDITFALGRAKGLLF
jgi:hypothetical protein